MIPFGDAKRQFEQLKPAIDSSIARVFESGWFILGNECTAFEREFAEFCRVKHAIGVGSGTEALHLALVAAGVKPGDEVITVPNSAAFTASAISFAGATPVFVDIDPEFYTMDPGQIEKAITAKTRAIIPVHLYGQCADMPSINRIAERHGITVIEDACQAHGAKYEGRRSGSMGLAGCFSFYPSKNLGGYGDGGMITTDDAAVAERLRMLRNGGQEQRYYHKIIGYNSRLDELQAAVLRVKLPILDSWSRRRNNIAARYASCIVNPLVSNPRVRPCGEHVFHLYVIRCMKRDELKRHLETCGVQTLIHYPIPIHLQAAYSFLGKTKGTCPVAEKYAGEILSLPMYPELNDQEITAIIDAVNSFEG